MLNAHKVLGFGDSNMYNILLAFLLFIFCTEITMVCVSYIYDMDQLIERCVCQELQVPRGENNTFYLVRMSKESITYVGRDKVRISHIGNGFERRIELCYRGKT